MRRHLAIAAGVAVFLGWASSASAYELMAADVAVPRALDAGCTTSLGPAGDGVAHRELTAPAAGYLTARLEAGGGDWDLAVYPQGGGQPVAASAYSGSIEVAAGYVARGDELVVQACRRTGGSAHARVNVSLEETDTEASTGTPSLVRVSTPTVVRRVELDHLGLDFAEHGGRGFVDLVLHGSSDAATLRRNGYSYKVLVDDLAAQARRDRLADERYQAAVTNSTLPSGRDTYRRLANISAELKALANGNPDIVKPFQLPHLTGEGRPVEGIEITTDPNARDGKPAFLLVGMHHAREWPAADIQMEWARQLIDDYRAGNSRTRSLVAGVRTIIVPVTNADGYNSSREAGRANGHDAGEVAFNAADVEYRRKNCRLTNGTHNCNTPPSVGVDPNRNYAAFWGGVGSPDTPTQETYRGTAPFSEPEIRDIRELVATRQVVALITTHTFGRTILRQPGVQSQPPTPDEPMYKALGDSLAAANGYTSEFSKDLYDHGGTTDAWSYHATGGLAFVFELNSGAFHPPFQQMVDEYDGTFSGHGGNREAFYRMTEFAANPAGHAILKGTGPAGAVLRVEKDFLTDTQEGPDVPDHLETTTVIPASGQFEWHVNQSTRPLTGGAGGTESWTLSCEIPEGSVRSTTTVAIARGESRDVSPCPKDASTPDPGGGSPAESPPTPTDAREQPRLGAKLAASFNGRTYSVRVKGSLFDTTDLDALSGIEGGRRCEGTVAVTLSAKGRRIASGRAPVHGACGFERSFRIKLEKLPRALRTPRGLRSMQALAQYSGGPYLLGAQDDSSARVKKRRG